MARKRVLKVEDDAVPLTDAENKELAVTLANRAYNAQVPINQIEALAFAVAEFAEQASIGSDRSPIQKKVTNHLVAAAGMIEDRCRELRKTLYGREDGP